MRLPDTSNRFLANVLQVFRGTALAQLILLATTPLLTRLFAPDAFGELVVYQAILTFGLVASAFRYEYAILLPDEDETAADLVLIGLVSSTIIAAILLAVAGTVKFQPFNIPLAISDTLIYVPFALLFGGWAQTLNYWALRQKNFRVNANAKIARASSLSVVALTGGYIKPVGTVLMIADVVGRLISLVFLFRQLSENLTRHLKNCDLSRLLRAVKIYKSFPTVSLPSSMINTAAFSLTPFVMMANYGLAVTGFYALVDRVFGAPSALIGTAVGQVYMTELAELKRTSPSKLRNLFLRVGITQAKLAIIPVVVIWSVAPDLFSLVFGSIWAESGVYARSLAILYFLGFVFTPVSATLTILEYQKWQLLWDSSRLVTVLAAWGFVAWFDLPPVWGLFVYSLTMSSFIVIYLGLCLLSFKQIEKAS